MASVRGDPDPALARAMVSMRPGPVGNNAHSGTFAKAIALRPARANRCECLGHSADPCFPTWGGEVEPVGCADIAHRTAFRPSRSGPRGLGARGFRREMARPYGKWAPRRTPTP